MEQGQDEKARSMMEHEQRIAERKRKADEIRMKHEKVDRQMLHLHYSDSFCRQLRSMLKC